MTDTAIYTASVIIIVALVTWLTRWIPYMFFGGKNGIPKVVSYLGDVLPASIMIILVLYCLRNTTFTAYPYGGAELLSVALVVLLQLWKKNTLVSAFLGTACYMVLIRIM